MRLFAVLLAAAIALPTAVYAKGGQGGASPPQTGSNQAAGSQPNSTSTQNTPAVGQTQSAASTAAFESQVQAFSHLDDITTPAATAICAYLTNQTANTADNTIVIYDQTSFSSVQSYESFVESANAIISIYNNLLPPAQSANAGPFVPMSASGGGGGGG